MCQCKYSGGAAHANRTVKYLLIDVNVIFFYILLWVFFSPRHREMFTYNNNNNVGRRCTGGGRYGMCARLYNCICLGLISMLFNFIAGVCKWSRARICDSFTHNTTKVHRTANAYITLPRTTLSSDINVTHTLNLFLYHNNALHIFICAYAFRGGRSNTKKYF